MSVGHVLVDVNVREKFHFRGTRILRSLPCEVNGHLVHLMKSFHADDADLAETAWMKQETRNNCLLLQYPGIFSLIRPIRVKGLQFLRLSWGHAVTTRR